MSAHDQVDNDYSNSETNSPVAHAVFHYKLIILYIIYTVVAESLATFAKNSFFSSLFLLY